VDRPAAQISLCEIDEKTDRIALIGDISVTLICSMYGTYREKITDLN